MALRILHENETIHKRSWEGGGGGGKSQETDSKSTCKDSHIHTQTCAVSLLLCLVLPKLAAPRRSCKTTTQTTTPTAIVALQISSLGIDKSKMQIRPFIHCCCCCCPPYSSSSILPLPPHSPPSSSSQSISALRGQKRPVHWSACAERGQNKRRRTMGMVASQLQASATITKKKQIKSSELKGSWHCADATKTKTRK